MSQTVEIDTVSGVVRSTSSALAQVVADLVAAEYRATERDLFAVLGMSLEDDEVGASVGETPTSSRSAAA